MYWARGGTVLSLVTSRVPFSIPRRTEVLILTFMCWGGAKVSGPILTNGGLILLGGWATGYAWAVGGGVEYRATDSMAIRTGADYLENCVLRFFAGGSRPKQS